MANNVLNDLQATYQGWSTFLTRKHAHIYLTRDSEAVLLKKSAIIKLQRHFKLPAAGKLYEVMKYARPKQVDEATQQLLEKVT